MPEVKMKTIDLTDKVAVVVGAAGDIGSGITISLAEAGAKTVIVDIDKEHAASLMEKLKKNFKSEPRFYKCNVCSEKDVSETIEKIISENRKIDILVYSAGYSSFSEFSGLSSSEWEKAMDINLKGAFYFCRDCTPYMLKEKKGNIILICSTTSINGSGGGAHYAVSKIGLLGLMKSMTYDLLSKGIRVNAVSPGVINTKMLRIRYPDTPEVNQKIIDGIPLGRMGTPEDIGNIVTFLASDLSEYICGQEIIADGGRIIYRRPK
jgi:3-oxoacyl-[acyl-carrier protein] reductase